MVTYVVDRIKKGGGIPTPEEITKATGVELSSEDKPSLQVAVMQKLKEDPEAMAHMPKSRCNDYGACSVGGDLASATGEELAMYVKDKAEDGKTFESYAVPAFEAERLEGGKIHSNTLTGQPILLVTLAGHCSHSMDSLPILKDLQSRYAKQGIKVVAVYVNSGSVEDMKSWLPAYASPNFDVWVYDNINLGEILGSHLTPSYFLINAQGQIKEKWIGFKTQEVLQERLDHLLKASLEAVGR